MEMWSYLILTAALFALVALMLYAKLSSRSRGKLLHHSPGDVSLDSLARLPVQPTGTVRDDLGDFDVFSTDLGTAEDTPPMSGPQSNSSETATMSPAEWVKLEPVSGDHGEEEEYLDELQEAAAGLAMLMRSSPVLDRPAPVIFAPEEEAEEGECRQEETILIPTVDPASDREGGVSADADEVADEVDVNVLGESISDPESVTGGPEMEDTGETVKAGSCREAANIDSCEEKRIGEEAVRVSLQELLGEEVAHRFSEIDESLDALESLVAGVESRLADWNLSSGGGAENEIDPLDVGKAA